MLFVQCAVCTSFHHLWEVPAVGGCGSCREREWEQLS